MATLLNPVIQHAFITAENGYRIRTHAITEIEALKGNKFLVWIGSRKHTLKWDDPAKAQCVSDKLASSLKSPYTE